MSVHDVYSVIFEPLQAVPAWLYPAAVVLVGIGLVLYAMHARFRHDDILPSTVAPLGPVELGLLYSRRNALLGALGELHAAGVVDERGRARRAAESTLIGLHPVSRAVHASLLANQGRRTWTLPGCARRELDATDADLRSRGLLAGSLTRWKHVAITLPLAVIGLALLIARISERTPSAVEVATTGLATCLAVAMVFHTPEESVRTTIGDVILRQERRNHDALHPRFSPALSTYGVRMLAFAAALFGPLALTQLAPGVAGATYMGDLTTDGGSGGGDSTGATCGGCGGSSGGGGGGCGDGGAGGGGGCGCGG